MALTLKDLMESRSKLAKQDQAGAPERISMSDFKKMMGASGDDDKQTEILSNIESLTSKDSTVQKAQTEKFDLLLEKDTEGNNILGNINNVLKQTLSENKKHTSSLNKIGTISGSDKPTAEQIVEGEKNQAEVLKLLHIIAENTADRDPEKADKKGKAPLGGIGTALAIALGGLAGAISGYVKAIVTMNKMLFGAIGDSIVAMGKFFPKIRNTVASLEAAVEIYIAVIKDSIGKFIGGIVEVFAKIKDNITNIVARVMNSDAVKSFVSIIGKTIEGIKSFFAPIGDAFKAIQEVSNPISKMMSSIEEGSKGFFSFFEAIGTKISAFAKVFKAVAVIFEKIAIPITIIMTLYDTIIGAIEGFKKEGVIGGIKGAIKGLMNSLIWAPIDLLKDGVSWILGAFGFDEAEKMLDSFSFEDLFSKYVDAIFSPIETIKKLFSGAVEAIENIEIPEIGFTIPIIDKKVSIGPFHPFKSEEQTATAPSTPGSTAQAQAPSTPGEVTAQPTAQRETKKTPEKNLEFYEKAWGTDPKRLAELQKKAGPDGSGLTDAEFTERANLLSKEKAARRSYKTFGTGSDEKTAEVTPPAPTDASAVYSKSANNAQSAMEAQNGTPPVIVSAPVQNTNVKNEQNIAMPKPTRNNDSGFNRYIQNSAVFL